MKTVATLALSSGLSYGANRRHSQNDTSNLDHFLNHCYILVCSLRANRNGVAISCWFAHSAVHDYI